MKAKRTATTVIKVLVCALLLFITLFPIYWLIAMGIRPTDEMKGHIALIPQTLTLEHFAQLFPSKALARPLSTAYRRHLVPC